MLARARRACPLDVPPPLIIPFRFFGSAGDGRVARLGHAEHARADEQRGPKQVDGGDAQAVGEDATGGDAGEAAGLPDDVVEGEDSAAESVGDGGLQDRANR